MGRVTSRASAIVTFSPQTHHACGPGSLASEGGELRSTTPDKHIRSQVRFMRGTQLERPGRGSALLRLSAARRTAPWNAGTSLRFWWGRPSRTIYSGNDRSGADRGPGPARAGRWASRPEMLVAGPEQGSRPVRSGFREQPLRAAGLRLGQSRTRRGCFHAQAIARVNVREARRGH